MNLVTVIDGIGKGLTEPVLGMKHLVFCLMAALMLFVLRKKPSDAWLYLLALVPGYVLERLLPMPVIVVNVIVALTVTLVLFQQWMYEKLAAWTRPLLLVAGLVHGISLTKAALGSTLSSFIAYAVVATLVQALVIYVFGRLCRRIAEKSPDGFEGLENILSAVGTGVALASFFLAF